MTLREANQNSHSHPLLLRGQPSIVRFPTQQLFYERNATYRLVARVFDVFVHDTNVLPPQAPRANAQLLQPYLPQVEAFHPTSFASCVSGVASWNHQACGAGVRQISGMANLPAKKSALWTREFLSAISPSSQPAERRSASLPAAPAAMSGRRRVGYQAKVVRLVGRSMPCSPTSSRASADRRAA